MTERINIQYSLEIDEIPGEVQRAVSKAAQEKLKRASSLLKHADWTASATEVIEGIHQIRQLLFAVDERLDDIDAIMRGYYIQRAKGYQEHPPDEGSGPPIVSQGGEALPASEETMQTIRAQLAAHKRETDALKATFGQGWDGDIEDEK